MSCTGQARRAAQPPADHGVARPGVPRPDAAARGAPAADRHGGGSRLDEVGEADQVLRVERAVTVDHRDQRCGGRQHAGVHRGAVAGPVLGDHLRAVRAGDRGGVVARAVVDDDGPHAGGDGGEHRRQRQCLVAARQHHVAAHLARHPTPRSSGEVVAGARVRPEDPGGATRRSSGQVVAGARVRPEDPGGRPADLPARPSSGARTAGRSGWDGGHRVGRSGAWANSRSPASGSTAARKPSPSTAAAGEATTCRTSAAR